MIKVTTTFNGVTTHNYRPREIAFGCGDWHDIDPLMGTMTDRDLGIKFSKYKATTIGARRRKFGIPKFDITKTEEYKAKHRASKAERQRIHRLNVQNPGRELNTLLAKWRVGNLEQMTKLKKLLPRVPPPMQYAKYSD